MSDAPLRAGVIGTGSMGTHHVRVYDELEETDLVGVYDVDTERTRAVAEEYDTEVYTLAGLLEAVDVVTVATPTEHHFETVHSCIEAGVHALVEKPFVDSVQRGEALIDFAAEEGITLQVGHIERFNPAVQELLSVCADLDVIAVTARRLGPQDREMDVSAVLDLMIHDIDIALALLDDPIDVNAAGTPDGEYATATFRTEAGQVGSLTASRITEEKVRELTVTAADCWVTLDFIGQTIEIRRQSVPEYIRTDGAVNYAHESVVENLYVERSEPLKNELAAFVEAVRSGAEPPVTARDGLRAVELAQHIDEATTTAPTPEEPTPLVE